MKPLYCNYCRQFKEPTGFKLFRHIPSGSPRRMCLPCQEIRKLPRAELEKRAKDDARARADQASRIAREAADQKRKTND